MGIMTIDGQRVEFTDIHIQYRFRTDTYFLFLISYTRKNKGRFSRYTD